ncbi:Uncharacterised protein [Serratia entomophila]|nr:Uncharacterised protein [Serratia entomophila]CAI2931056.1 Uncharacterised protein [Serratia entomophila]
MTTAFSSPRGSPEDNLTRAEFARMLGNANVQELYRDHTRRHLFGQCWSCIERSGYDLPRDAQSLGA